MVVGGWLFASALALLCAGISCCLICGFCWLLLGVGGSLVCLYTSCCGSASFVSLSLCVTVYVGVGLGCCLVCVGAVVCVGSIGRRFALAASVSVRPEIGKIGVIGDTRLVDIGVAGSLGSALVSVSVVGRLRWLLLDCWLPLGRLVRWRLCPGRCCQSLALVVAWLLVVAWSVSVLLSLTCVRGMCPCRCCQC